MELSAIKTLLQKVLDVLRNQAEIEEEVILNARDVAKILAIDVGTLYAKCERGDIPHFKIGKRYKFRRTEIDAWLETGPKQASIDVDEYVNRYLQAKKIKG